MSMNAPFVPDDLQSSYADAFALLKILADPAAHKQRLDELVAQENSAREQIAALNEMAADTRRKNSAAEALTIVLTNRKTALDTREGELDTRAKSLEQSETKKSDAALQRREKAVQAREDAATLEAERLAAMRADLEAKHGRIKNLAGAL
jgi:hypothetical protein